MAAHIYSLGNFYLAETDTASAVSPSFIVGDMLWTPSAEFSGGGRRHVTFHGFDSLPGLGRFIEPARTISLHVSPPEGDGYRTALLFWVSLFGLIVSPVSAASTAVVAWISVHRGRADAMLKEAQLEKTRLETELLRGQLERARLEAEQGQPRIVVVTV